MGMRLLYLTPMLAALPTKPPSTTTTTTMATPTTTKPPPPEEAEDDVFKSLCDGFCEDDSCENRGSKNADIFIPYGADYDTMGERSDDGYDGPITLQNDVPFLGQTYNNIYFSTNGAITFGEGITTYTSSPFPIYGTTMFSPFWADVDMSEPESGQFSYRLLSADDLVTVSDIVNFELENENFAATDGIVVTYDKVAYYGRSSQSDRSNTIQAILVHDTVKTFAIFQYGDVEWTTGTASNGDSCSGLGGSQAQVGFNDGTGYHYTVPGSQTNNMELIDDQTNCKSTGRFIFRVDDIDSVNVEIEEETTTTTERPGRCDGLQFCYTNDCSNRGSKNEGIFIAFGPAAGDYTGASRDDHAEGPFFLTNSVPYFGNTYNEIYFSSNGAISFNEKITGYTSSSFPLYGKTMFSPFWADMNVQQTDGGSWYYRTLSADDLSAVSDIVRYELDAHSSFTGTDGVVVTYDRVAFFGRNSDSDRTNKIQAILVHDTSSTFAIFQYGDIEWTTGTASQGGTCTGLGGTPAQVGFNDGYGAYYTVEGSQTSQMEHIDDMTNCKSTGRFIFKVDNINDDDEYTEPDGDVIPVDNFLWGIRAFLESTDISEDRVSEILNHGCHCKTIDNGDRYEPGVPVDELDRICRDWIYARDCTLRNNGVCQDGPVFYMASGANYDTHTGLMCSHYAASTDACEHMSCDVDRTYYLKVKQFLNIDTIHNFGWTPDTTAACPPRADAIVPRKDSCCGLYASTLEMYYSGTSSCVNGVVN